MSIKFNNIRDYNVMYLSAMIGEQMSGQLTRFDFENLYYSNKVTQNQIINTNFYLYNLLISIMGGVTNFTSQKLIKEHDILYCKINEIIYDNFNDEKKINYQLNEYLKDIKLELKDEYKNKNSLPYFQLNSAKFLIDPKNSNKSDYYSLIFLSVPFALKIKDKKDMIKSLEKFIRLYDDDVNQILATLTCALFINYALNDVGINIWIDKLNEDFRDRKDCEKYLDYINNYVENNFRNGEFILRQIDEFTIERNKNFLNNYCSKKNRLLSEKSEELVLLIYDTLLRSGENWEKLVMFGFCNWNDNPIISLVLGIIYQILFKNLKINKNLLKRFSFNL